MQEKTIKEIEREYELEIPRIVNSIKKQKAKLVLLQFPDGLKPYSTIIAKEIERKAGCECIIWFESCFGACDVPLEAERLGIQMIVQFGHSPWSYKRKDIKII